MIPFVIDNQQHRLADALNELLAVSAGKALDIVTAYFSISGYRLVKDGLHQLGGFRLLIGSDPQAGADIGLRPHDRKVLQGRLRSELDAEPFAVETLRLVEDLIAFLRSEKVEVRLYDKGFLHAKAYLFHQDDVSDHNRGDRIRPYAAIVGSRRMNWSGSFGWSSVSQTGFRRSTTWASSIRASWARSFTPERSTRFGAFAMKMGPCLTRKSSGRNWLVRRCY